MPRALIAGNWKMNCLREEGLALTFDLLGEVDGEAACDWLICPPFTLLGDIAEALNGSPIALGAQDCHGAVSGAHTGDVSAAMLADRGCRFVIVGHSERRQDHGESSALVKAKAEAAQGADLTPIVCVGETRAEREAGRALTVVGQQLRDSLPAGEALVVAYEPVWAIGTGLTPTLDDVAEMHGHLAGLLEELRGAALAGETRVLYGGSVKPGNAADLLAVAGVHGALVGGASLKAEDFLAIGYAVAGDH